MKKSCELCKSQARIYCAADEASLCWTCDAKVHSANFLVARHSRCLLCHVCQSPTAWSAVGDKLGRTVSVCESCIDGSDGVRDGAGGVAVESEGGNDDETDTDGDFDDGDDEDEDDEDRLDVDDEDGDNQVVPWSSASPPPVVSSSSSGESSSRFSNGDRDVSSKGMGGNVADLCSDDDLDCSSSLWNNQTPRAARSTGGVEATADFVDSLTLRPLKTRRIEADGSGIGSRSAAIAESLKRFHQQDMISGDGLSPAISGTCRLSKNPVDFGSSEAP